MFPMIVRRFLPLLFGVAFAAAPGRALFLPGEEDALLIDDGEGGSGAIAAGDFNGDGKRDIALMVSATTSTIHVFLAGRWTTGRPFSTERSVKIVGKNLSLLRAGDVNADGRDDLVFSTLPNAPAEHGARVILGRSEFSGTIDLSVDPPDVQVVSSSPTALDVTCSDIAVGDVTGDGVADMVIGAVNSGVVLLVPGGAWLGTGTLLDAWTDSRVKRFIGKTGAGMGGAVSIGRMDGDAVGDILLSEPYYRRGTSNLSGAFYVFRGTSAFPAVWDLNATPADLTVLGVSYSQTQATDLADFNGDGVDDIVVTTGTTGVEKAVGWVDGASVMAKRPAADLQPGSAQSVSVHPFHFLKSFTGFLFYFHRYTLGDFDGDGRADILGLGAASNNALGLQSVLHLLVSPAARFGDGPYPMTGDLIVQSPSYVVFHLADLNADGRDDLILHLPSYLHYDRSPPPYYGELMVVNGYRLLSSPTLHATTRNAGSRRATLTLGVEGDPTDMWLTGDVDPSIRDRWIPFQSSFIADLTGHEGPKTLRAKFRNAARRESDWAEASVTLAIDGPGATIVSNRCRPGRPARVDLRLTAPARVSAKVVGPRGEDVVRLHDGESPSGVATLSWDGTNAAGRRVAPGIYWLLVDVDGNPTKHRVVLE
jgi:hypothetical protein